MSLEKKIASGVSWVALGKILTQVMSFLVFVVVARFIGPDEFGLAALCYVFMALFQLIFMGISEGIVVLQIKDNKRLSSLFWAIFLISVILAGGCYMGANSVAAFYEEPKMAELLRVFSIFPIIVGIQAIPRMILMKDMDFRAYALRPLLAILGGGAVGIYMASKGYGALSLIVQQNVQFLIAALIFWWFSKWRPSFHMKHQEVVESVKPGLKKITSDGLNFIKEQSPRVLLGHFLGAASVGYYGFANRMATALQEMLTTPVFMVLFPALSKTREEAEQQERILAGFFYFVSCLVAPAVVLAVMTAPLYVPIIFGEKWTPAIPVLQIVLAASLVLQYARIPSVIFRSYNKLQVQLCGEVVLVGLTLFALWHAAQHSAVAVASALLITTLLYPPVLYSLLKWKVGVNLWAFTTLLLRPIMAIIAMIAVVFLLIENINIHNALLELFAALFCGGGVYLLFALALMRKQIKLLLAFALSLKNTGAKITKENS